MPKKNIWDTIESFDITLLQAFNQQVDQLAPTPEAKADLCRVIVYRASNKDKLDAALQVRADALAEDAPPSSSAPGPAAAAATGGATSPA